MRSVNKGSDRGSFNPYQDACTPLQDAIGEYCSYCERWIASAIEVEHILPKKSNPSRKFRWINFLLACKNCNSGKSAANISLKDYLWPDRDNTFLAFVYDDEGRVYPRSQLPSQIAQKAKATWELTNLHWHPDVSFPGMHVPSAKDKRYVHRKQAWTYATDKRHELLKLDTPDRRLAVAKDALQRGMFSVWMTVFGSNSEMDRSVRLLLIQHFTGTAVECFDRFSNPRRSATGTL